MYTTTNNKFTRFSIGLIFLTSAITVMFMVPVSVNATELPRCLYVSSYHKGYAWSDALEEGVRNVLKGRCQIMQFDMDTKRNKSVEDKELAAVKAVELINSWKPNIVITSDDNAAKYLIVPYFNGSSIPFIFSGVNWTVKEYGFPFDNVTGIVEVAPIIPMLEEAQSASGGRSAVYLGADTLTEKKNYERISQGAGKLGITLTPIFVSTFDAWLSAFDNSQSANFLVIGSNSGISGWNNEKAREYAIAKSKIISVTNHEWMMPVTAMGYTKIPQEHGEWAATVSLAVLDGTPVNEIPIVTNRKWDLWINKEVARATRVELSRQFTRNAKQVASTE